MSLLRFTINELDPVTYTSVDSSVTFPCVVDEPVGLDSVNLHIKRDDTYHGFLDAVDDSLGSLRFYNTAYNILKYAYQTYGLQANVTLLIEYACDDTGSFDTLYTGVFSFDKYKEVQGLEGCYVEVGVENGQALMLFRNRMDTKVCLDSTAAMGDGYDDGSIASLAPYDGLGLQVMLNPMLLDLMDSTSINNAGIGSRSYSFVYADNTSTLQTCVTHPAFIDLTPGDNNASDTENNEFNLWGATNSAVITPFTTINSDEFGTLSGGVGETHQNNGIPGSPAHSLTTPGWGVGNLSDPEPFFQFDTDMVYESTMVQIDVELSGAIIAGHHTDSGQENGATCTPEISVGIYKGQTWGDVAGHGANLYKFCSPDISTNSQGCIIDVTKVMLDYPNNGGTNLMNDTYNGNINYCSFKYSFHTSSQTCNDGVKFNPGDKLWVLVEVANTAHITPHVVLFSGDYTYRNSYRQDWMAGGVTGNTTDYPLTPITDSSNTTTNVLTLTQQIDPPYGQVFAPQSYIKLSFPSLFQGSAATAYMVNESLSRIAESATNGALTVYSQYFGRTDSHPYNTISTTNVDGPGALECITTGLLIRGYSPLAALQMSAQNPGTLNMSGSFTIDFTTDMYNNGQGYILLVSGGTVTIPEDGLMPLAIGAQIILQQIGADAASIVGGPVSTGGIVSVVATSGTPSTSGQNTQVLLTRVGVNSWLVSSRSTMSVSFKELFDALHSIHAVGFGDEPAPDGSGNTVIRVEPISYFYDNDTTAVVKKCDNVDILETSVDTPNVINVFKSGYQKWEAEEAQGLDEFLSRRFFRTTLFHVRNAWDKICKFVASGYAVEATRRKLGTDTTDWRFDNENFIICLQRGGGPGAGSGATAVAQVNGANAVSGITVTSPGTGYTSPPTITLEYGGNYTTQATATAVVSTSAPYGILSINVGNPGVAYDYPPTVIITPVPPGGVASGYSSEQGNALGSTSAYIPAQGMINPPTVYNYRISPIRNALRWLRYIIASYADWTTGKLIFESGGGNYTAIGYNASVDQSGTTYTIDTAKTALDTVEGRLLSESDTLSMADYAGNADKQGSNTAAYAVKPIYRHELVKFKYPVSYADWKNIFNNKYKLIEYSVNGNGPQYGYLQELKYNLIEGVGEFTLKPMA